MKPEMEAYLLPIQARRIGRCAAGDWRPREIGIVSALPTRLNNLSPAIFNVSQLARAN